MAIVEADLPKDLTLEPFLDYTIFIEHSIEEVKETLAIAVVLVIIIIFLFFRDWILAIRPLIDIPVSLIANYLIQNKVRLDWRFISSALFSALMAVYYALSETIF